MTARAALMFVAALGVSCSTAVVAVGPDGKLPDGSLMAIFGAAHSGKDVDRDKFGQPFRFTFAVSSRDGGSGRRATYHFDDGQLIVSVGSEPAGSYPKLHPKLLMLQTKQAVVGGFDGVTGFGVKRRVQVRRAFTDAVALVSAPLTDEAPPSKYLPPARVNDYFLVIETTRAGAAVLGRDIDLVVEGRFAALPDSNVYACEDVFHEADVSTPADVNERKCWVGANVRRIAFVQRSTGKTLKEWTTME